MKQIRFFLLIFSTLIISCNNKVLIIDSPQQYNDSLVLNFIKIQNPIDSLISKLIFINSVLETNPQKKCENLNFDTEDLKKQYLLCNERIIEVDLNMKKFEYYKSELIFKPKMEWAIGQMNNLLNEDIKAIIEIISNSDTKNANDILIQISAFGKSMMNKYNQVFDSLYYGQNYFSSANKYFLENNIIKKNF